VWGGGEDIVFEYQLITVNVSHNRPYRTVSCAAPAYLLYTPRDSITLFLYNLETSGQIFGKSRFRILSGICPFKDILFWITLYTYVLSRIEQE